MLDLSARVFYKAHFDIEASNQGVSVFEEIIRGLYNWLYYKYGQSVAKWNWQQLRRYGEFQTDDCKVEASSTSYIENNLLYWACKIDEYQVQDTPDERAIEEAPRIWTTEVGFEQITATKATISYVLYYRDKAGFIGTIANSPTANVPGFIKSLLFSKKVSCLCGNAKLSAHSQKIEVGSGMNFAEKVEKEGREIPFILVAPFSTEEEEIEYSINPESIAKNVMGNAVVYCPTTIGALDEINYFISSDLRCRPGQIMIYWPTSAPTKCRFISAYQAEQLGESEVVNILRRAFSTDIKYYDVREMFRMSDCKEMYRKSRIEELKRRIETAKLKSDEKDITNAELQEQLQEQDELIRIANEIDNDQRAQIDKLQAQIDEQKQENWKLVNKVESIEHIYKTAQDQLDSLNAVRNIAALPQSPIDIGQYFRTVFQDRLDFTERGLKSLKNCSTKTGILWECFYLMATYLPDLYREGTADIEAAYKEKTSWDLKRGEGKMTRKDKDLMTLRDDTYQGHEIKIEPHVANGNKESDPDFVRVYFAYDDVSQKIIIGHVGKHLDNYSTRKQ